MRAPAAHGSWCPRCGQEIRQLDEVVLRKGDWIHAGCAPGGDDQ